MVDYTSVVSHTSTHFFKRKGNLIFWVAFSIVSATINLRRKGVQKVNYLSHPFYIAFFLKIW